MATTLVMFVFLTETNVFSASIPPIGALYFQRFKNLLNGMTTVITNGHRARRTLMLEFFAA
jgi:hypothetical protein